ncbi:hypothetical protein B0J13DRAFT_654582 [Dactylonectria estremocensis]|uniref:Uncharacterized protein n=1 Tax=Dactylonectria estremocensis TaxID=1079267 RepID=A0A9P9F6U2_9HYPO|nr:hypothetical protein B0J13DRAFT_654582 [Dactylonectria estremocensis]
MGGLMILYGTERSSSLGVARSGGKKGKRSPKASAGAGFQTVDAWCRRLEEPIAAEGMAQVLGATVGSDLLCHPRFAIPPSIHPASPSAVHPQFPVAVHHPQAQYQFIIPQCTCHPSLSMKKERGTPQTPKSRYEKQGLRDAAYLKAGPPPPNHLPGGFWTSADASEASVGYVRWTVRAPQLDSLERITSPPSTEPASSRPLVQGCLTINP